MKLLELLIVLLFLSLASTGQAVYTTTREHVVEKVYLEATATGVGARSVSNVTYLDGFRRKLQEIAVFASPGGSGDIIIPLVYGALGRVEREYLPYAKAGNRGAYDSNALAESNWNIYGRAEAAHAFTLTAYDNSLDDRVIKRTGPGGTWHEAGRGVTTTYGFNAAGEVRRYRASLDGTLTIDGTYPAGVLRKTVVADEDGGVVETFTGGQDQVLLTVSVSGSDRLETYSVYDVRGLLRHVLSPEASLRMGTTINEIELRELAYRYDYDSKGRLVVKRLPGCDPVYMVYDRKDRLVMSQDGKQRAENASKWSYSLYDGKNRVIETGEVVLSSATAHASLQAIASASLSYTPSGTRAALQYTLYDTYTATTNVPVRPFVATSGYTSAPGTRVTGLVTSVKTRVFDMPSETWLTTTTYYDDRCRVIQTVSDNLHGRLSRVDLKYDFTGNVVQQRESHSINASQTDVLESVNVYDDRGRLLSTTTRLNNGSPATVSCTYDAVGRLVSRKLGAVTEAMTYNARGWLTGKESVPFKMKLRYESPAGGTTARWNGNISEWEWQHGTSVALMYGFVYDGVNRLTGTTQKQKSGASWIDLGGNYLEYGLAYDRNGNIKTLRRTAGGDLVDDLVYSYTGNRLTGLTENANPTTSGDVYVRGGTAAGSYAYDKNGNMINDSRRALNLSYNVLNLLREVKTTSGELKARYNYLADGTKLRVRDASDNGFDYLGSLTYKSSSVGLQLESASFGDGVLRASEVNYFLTDHLGSVRVVVDGSGVVKERNDYYPFGARHVRGDYPQLDDNRYKYNDKEEQVTGDVDYLDYGARMYDSGLGRWFSIDPRLERYVNISPYVYCANNPIILVDVNGEYIDPASEKQWNDLTESVQTRRREILWLLNFLSSTNFHIDINGMYYDCLQSYMSGLWDQLAYLNSIIKNFSLLELSDQKYTLKKLGGGMLGFVSYNKRKEAVEIWYLNESNLVHELTHAAQFEIGEIAFVKKKGRSKNTFFQDIFDEVAAYRAQYAFKPSSLNGINPRGNPMLLRDITSLWVQGIEHPRQGKIYAPGSQNRIGEYPLNINSGVEDFKKAYPYAAGVFTEKSIKNLLEKLKYKK